MSGYNVFSNLSERTAYPVETKWINTDPSGQFSIIDNELVLENVGITALNDELLTVDGSGLVSKLNTAVILPNQDLNTTDSPEFVGLTLTGIPNDDTEDKLIVIDAITDQLEYRNKSSLHDQNLDTTGTPSWQSAGIKGTEFVLSTFNDSLTRFHQAPAVTTNDKLFEFQSDTDTGAVRLDVNNNGNKSAGVKLTTTNIGTGNNFIQYENGGNRWFSGVNKANNEFAVHYSPGDPTDNLYNAANERLTLTNTGHLTVNQLAIDGDNLIIDTIDPSTSTFIQNPIPPTGVKEFLFSSRSNDLTVSVHVANDSNNPSAHAGICIESDHAIPSGGGGNTLSIYSNAGGVNWQAGHKKSDSTYRWNYSAIAPDFLVNDANTKMNLSNTGDLTVVGSVNSDTLILQNVVNDDAETKLMTWDIVGKACKFRNVSSLPVGNPFDQDLNTFDPVDFLSVDINNNTLINSNTDSLTNFTQTPAITTGYKEFAFLSDTSDSPVVVAVINSDLSATAHTGIVLHNPSVGGGNQLAIYETPTENQWTVGRQRTSDTFRWNNSAAGSGDFLTVDANTKMSLSNTGVLGLNADNVIISASTDSITGFAQLPAVTTGDKIFQFSSQTSDAESRLEIVNSTSGATAHSCLAANSQLSGGNMFTKYLRIGFAQWISGYQASSSDFRLNYDGIGTDNLDIDANTRLKLTNTGTLALNADNIVITPSTDSLTTFLQTPAITTGLKEYVFGSNTSDNMTGLQIYNDNAALTAHSGVYIRTDKGTCTGLGGNQFIHFESCGLEGWAMGHQRSSNTFRWNYMTVSSDYLTNDGNTRMNLNSVGDLEPAGKIVQRSEIVRHAQDLDTTFVIDAITTPYVWTSARGGLQLINGGTQRFTVTPLTGIAQLTSWAPAYSYSALVSFSCTMRMVAGTDQVIKIECRGANVENGFVPNQFYGSSTVTLKNTTDWQSVSMSCYVFMNQTGWYRFTFANLTSANNITIRDCYGTMVKG